MCGIFVSIGFDPDPARIDIVAHRGPDGRGWLELPSPAGPVALGHRRLAIIDTSDAGLQPLSDASGRFWLTFNGEIYNYLELRDELRARGEMFTTETDSEVLLRAYMAWGEDCLSRLRGMFAFAIWDAERKRLFAARDRFGIKPLYVYETGGGVAFASEIKQLLRLPGQSGRMNLERVYDFLASGITDHTSETLFDDIRQVRGGECLLVETSAGRPTSRRWRWYLVAKSVIEVAADTAAETFRNLFVDAVRLHLRSDVPVGSCLSGGLDSSSIACVIAREIDRRGSESRLRTISACYGDKSVDEKPFMDAVVDHAATDPRFVFPRAEDVFARASEITWHQDEPYGSTSIFAQWSVFAEARRSGVKVMLDGQGADELLAGYHGNFPYYYAQLARSFAWSTLLRTIRERRRLHRASGLREMQRLGLALLPAPLAGAVRRMRSRTVLHDWLGSALLRQFDKAPDAVKTASAEMGLGPVSDLADLCLVQTFASNLQMLLHYEDRNSMAHSIEARVPMLDHPLAEFALSLGSHHKTVGATTKWVLREAMQGILPDTVRNRHDKLGFSTPEEAWFRGPLRGPALDGVENTIRLFPDLLNPQGTRLYVDDMLAGRRKVDFALWRIINLGIWGETFAVSV